jgi:hypothetical protein
MSLKKRILTKQEISDLSLGYNWNSEMGIDDFVRANNLEYEKAYSIYEMINERYIDHVYG